LTSHGWKLYAHPAFGRRLATLILAVDAIAKQQPQTYASHPKTKLLKRILDAILVEVPLDPNAPEYQLGNTLGPAYRHWRRVKFLSRFRLFFRFSSTSKAIVFAWVNDENTLRKAGARTDPYAVFTRRLRDGNPPDDWNALFQQAESSGKLDSLLKPAGRKMPD
jgi:toxin YhaV